MTSTPGSKMEIECAVCLQPSIHPVRLPCNHIFCFLCVKGVTIQSQRCPMCRREIPQSFLEHPALISDPTGSCPTPDEEGEQETARSTSAQAPETEDLKWFYQGRNGWWEYDERTAQELELHHKKGDKNCELLIAGFLYSIDFENMLQCRRNEPNRRRQIKRDLAGNVTDKKGIAGIRTIGNTGTTVSSTTATDTAVDDLSNLVSTIQISNQTDQRGPTLRNLVDLGAASGANIALTDHNDDDEDDLQDETN